MASIRCSRMCSTKLDVYKHQKQDTRTDEWDGLIWVSLSSAVNFELLLQEGQKIIPFSFRFQTENMCPICAFNIIDYIGPLDSL